MNSEHRSVLVFDAPEQPWPPALVFTCPHPNCTWAYHAPSEAGDRHQRAFMKHQEQIHLHEQQTLGF